MICWPGFFDYVRELRRKGDEAESVRENRERERKKGEERWHLVSLARIRNFCFACDPSFLKRLLVFPSRWFLIVWDRFLVAGSGESGWFETTHGGQFFISNWYHWMLETIEIYAPCQFRNFLFDLILLLKNM